MTTKMNRLAREKSLYLRQHAQNPVDWYPWGEEAFAKAASEDKPIFLSIGYSACHWCHVMERESFEDVDVAGLLNRSFISIKVDREERPDVDHFYMTVCQMLTGSGGWPLTIVMMPDRRPFFAGTYFPKTSKYGRPGLIDVLSRLAEIWTSHREDLSTAAARIASSSVRPADNGIGDVPGEKTLTNAFDDLNAEFDEQEGGFGTAPKFPTPHHLLFLLRYWKRTRNERALGIVETTLTRMRLGGIFDQLGFGFHRYSTDRLWRLPHFEKMLYDQALLAIAYTEAYQATKKTFFRKAAEEILAYVLRDLASAEGGFFAAEDADVEGEEGKFYFWTEEEVRAVLAPAEADFAIRLFGIEPGEANVLYLAKPMEESAPDQGLNSKALNARLEKIRRALLAARENRPRPAKDTKVLVDWNGLMISALAKAAQAFDDPKFAEAAAKAADFLLGRLRAPGGGLHHCWIDGEVRIPAFLDDYAFLIGGLIELYETVLDSKYIKEAMELCRFALDHFWDGEGGGFYFTSDQALDLPQRRKEFIDGAYPSGNSAMLLNLVRLGRMTGDGLWEDKARQTLKAMSSFLDRTPQALTYALTVLDFVLGPSLEVVIAGRPNSAETAALLAEIRRPFLPNKLVLLRGGEAKDADILRLAPFTKDMTAPHGKALAFVCSNYACSLPVSDPKDLRKIIADL